MSTTPTLDKYPAARQAIEDIYMIFNRHIVSRETPGASILVNLDHQSEILDTCLVGDAQAKQDAIIANIFLHISPDYYTAQDLENITQTYGGTVGAVISFFAAHDWEETIRHFPVAEYSARVLDIVQLEYGHPVPDHVLTALRNDRGHTDPTRRALAERALAAIAAPPRAPKPRTRNVPPPPGG